jgi:hypothetical protein
VFYTYIEMSQSQQSDFTSSLYDIELDNLTYLTPSNHLATPSGSQQTFDTFDPSFLRPAIPPTIPSTFERVGPDRRKAYVLYDKMSHSDWVDWWLQTDYGSKSKISWDATHVSGIWKDYFQVAHSADGAAKVMCKRCCAILEHPYTTKKDANGKVGRHGTTTMTRHLKTTACVRSVGLNQQKGELTKFLQKTVCLTSILLFLVINYYSTRIVLRPTIPSHKKAGKTTSYNLSL